MNQHIATLAVMLNLGVATVYAQSTPVKMTFSGTAVATTLSLLAGTVTDEDHLEGNGTAGSFTFRQLRTDGPSSQPPRGCTSTRYFLVVAGAGVFRFQDGNLLLVRIAEGSGCIDLTAGNTQLTVIYQIMGGTGRFTGASGDLTLKATFTPVFRNPSTNAPLLLTLTGEFEGAVLGRIPPSAELFTTPGSLSFTYRLGGPAPDFQRFYVGLRNGPVNLDYNLTSADPWLLVTPGKGTTGNLSILVSASINTTGLTPGVYKTVLTITAAGSNSVEVPVTLEVVR
jgi:BACON domain-containing protein